MQFKFRRCAAIELGRRCQRHVTQMRVENGLSYLVCPRHMKLALRKFEGFSQNTPRDEAWAHLRTKIDKVQSYGRMARLRAAMLRARDRHDET